MDEVVEVEGSYPLALRLRQGPVQVDIRYEECPFDPRKEFDCYVGTMACAHPRYTLGDEGMEDVVSDLRECESWDGMYDYLRERFGATVVMPLYLLDHSGLHLSAGAPFSQENRGGHYACDPGGWDTSTVGFVFDTEEGRERCGTPPEKVADALEWEVEEYGHYVSGECFYLLGTDHEGADMAVGGYYGEDSALEAARDELEGLYGYYLETVGKTREWARTMGAGFAGAMVPVDLVAA
jgi:hypothetical protein